MYNVNKKLRRAISFQKFKYRVLKPFGNKDYKRFIVLSRSRTGSNMLISFLNSHSQIFAHGEIFSKLNGKNYKEVLNGSFSKQPRKLKAVGFKIFYYHPRDDNSCKIWNELMNMQELYVIHLKRRNILRTLLSRKIAGVLDIWATRGPRSPQRVGEKLVEFKVEELKKGFEQTRLWEKEYEKRFNAHQMLDIYYEDLLSSSEKELKKIIDFLDLQYRKLQTNTRKQNAERFSELISNYQELKDAFIGSEWEPFFEE